ncbi:hypothetical protein GCM10027181_01970 [Rheinheimera gaetbuli]
MFVMPNIAGFTGYLGQQNYVVFLQLLQAGKRRTQLVSQHDYKLWHGVHFCQSMPDITLSVVAAISVWQGYSAMCYVVTIIRLVTGDKYEVECSGTEHDVSYIAIGNGSKCSAN